MDNVHSMNTSGLFSGKLPPAEDKPSDMLFFKMPVPDDSAGAVSSARKIMGTAHSRNVEALSHKAQAASKLVLKPNSKNPSKVSMNIPPSEETTAATSGLYAHVMHQLSRKGDVKVGSSDKQDGLINTDKIEVVSGVKAIYG